MSSSTSRRRRVLLRALVDALVFLAPGAVITALAVILGGPGPDGSTRTDLVLAGASAILGGVALDLRAAARARRESEPPRLGPHGEPPW
jgi:hypothetical protein